MARLNLLALACGSVALFGCGDTKTSDGGKTESAPSPAPGFLADGGSSIEACSAESKRMLLLGTDKALYTFDPASLEVRKGATLACPVEDVEHPTGLAVDRTGKALVIYERGGTDAVGLNQIFKVDPTTGSCEDTGFQPRRDVYAAHAAFVADAPGSSAESLWFQVQRTGDSTKTLAKLGRDLRLEDVAPLSAPGESELLPAKLAGTGDGRLFGLYSVYTRDPSSVREVDVGTGVLGEKTSVPADPASAEAQNWTAFSAWGGDFYLFKSAAGSFTSTAVRYRPSDRTIVPVDAAFPMTIIGASSSTCAPTQVR